MMGQRGPEADYVPVYWDEPTDHGRGTCDPDDCEDCQYDRTCDRCNQHEYVTGVTSRWTGEYSYRCDLCGHRWI